MRGRWLLSLVTDVVLAVAAVPARVHTESDLIAVRAHSEATLNTDSNHELAAGSPRRSHTPDGVRNPEMTP
jgi:hypothetical protein